MEFWNSEYLNKQALDNLKLYKYSSVDLSPVSKYILQPYWSWAVQFFPMWMAPNLITLTGLSFVIANVILVILFIPDLIGPGPSWIYFSFAIGIWLYSTFDNVDGKQARRTGSSSPLGELFDHGCDALNCSFGAVVQAGALGLGHGMHSVYVAFLAIAPFFFSTWEEYYTGTLYLGYINGPTEGLVISCITMILSGLYGPQIWKTLLRDILPSYIINPISIMHDFSSWSIIDVVTLGMSSLLFFMHIPLCILSVRKACRQKNLSFGKALLGTNTIVIFFASCYFWLNGRDSVILRNHCILFILMAGMIFGRIATKIILAYVTKMPYPRGTFMIIPLLVGAVNANSSLIFGYKMMYKKQEVLYLWITFIFVTIAYINWSIVIIQKFCKHLKINCLSLSYLQSTKKH